MNDELLFSDRVDAYDAHRPGYPPAVFDRMTAELTAPIRALDVGCGTGLSTRGVAPFVEHVVGVDPEEAMLEAARRCGGANITYRVARIESLDDAEPFDLVLCAQSFHWFDTEATLARFHALLRPAGRLALLWLSLIHI